MRVTSKEKLEDYQVIGDKLRIHWDHKQITVEDAEGEESTQWQCQEAVVKKNPSRDEIIESVIATQYSTYGAEIAAIRNGGADAEAHEDLRLKAKELADNWFN